MITENCQQTSYSLTDLLMLIWRYRLLCSILSLTSVLVALGIAFVTPKQYRADISISANLEHKSQIESQLSSLGNIIGVNSQSGSQEELYIAKLQSREFIYTFINRHNLLPILFSKKWDEESKAWKPDEDPPTIQDGYNKFFDQVFEIYRDYKSGITKISITWTDPKLAEIWANDIIKNFNSITAEKEKLDSMERIQYLSNALESSVFSNLQRTIVSSIENELRSNILAGTSKEFAFRVIDPAIIPDTPSSPKITVYLFAGFLFGFIFSLFVIAFLEVRKSA